MSPLGERIKCSFVLRGGRILDIGCGSGRDMGELARQGFQVFGTEAVEAFVQLAQERHPELKGRVVHASLPDMAPPFDGAFDGVLCSAVLMHLDETDLFNAALAIKRCLKIDGRLLISIPSQRSDVVYGDRDEHGRLFKAYQPAYLRLIFERLGLVLLDEWSNADTISRDGIAWVSLLFLAQVERQRAFHRPDQGPSEP